MQAMLTNIPPNELYINTDGVLLSRRLILSEAGTPLTRANLTSCTLNVYKLVQDTYTGLYARTLQSTQVIPINNVIPATVQTDVEGRQYNFRYCVENQFTAPNTLYLVEYILVDTNNHSIVITVKGRTRD